MASVRGILNIQSLNELTYEKQNPKRHQNRPSAAAAATSIAAIAARARAARASRQPAAPEPIDVDAKISKRRGRGALGQFSPGDRAHEVRERFGVETARSDARGHDDRAKTPRRRRVGSPRRTYSGPIGTTCIGLR